MAVSAGYLYFALAYLAPSDPCDTGPTNQFFWYVSFMARTFDFHVGLGFLGIAIFAAWFRRYGLAGAALPLCLLGLMPTIFSYFPRSQSGNAPPNLQIMSANLLWVNRNTAPLINEILEEKPDLLLLQEYTPRWHAAIQTALSSTYPYYVGHPSDEAFGAAIYAKYPLSEPYRFPGADPGDRSPFFRATAQISNREIAIYCVHIVPPSWFNRKLMPRQFCQLYRALSEEKNPMIVGGDFNFTRGASMDRQLRFLGLVEAHVESGIGRGATFKIPYLPDIAIDHVYLSQELTPTKCRTGAGQDSDHRPVIVDLFVPPAPTHAPP